MAEKSQLMASWLIANAKRLLDWISTVAMSETIVLAGTASALA